MPYVKHLYYEEAGRGQPLIFVHCPALSHVYWRPVMDWLQNRYRCIAIDIRGHGKSGLGEQPWTFADIAADLILLTRTLGLERPVLAGYSSGASPCFLAALERPDLFGGVVSVSGFSECTNLPLRAKVALGLIAVHLGLTRFIGPNVISTNTASASHLEEMLPDAKAVSAQALLHFFRTTRDTNFTGRLGELRLPVLLVQGADDDFMHGYYQMLKERLPNTQSLFFPGTDHRVPTRHPGPFAEAVAAFAASLPMGAKA